jgi:60 kDa SS-A/Ro ribonucleoprotein
MSKLNPKNTQNPVAPTKSTPFGKDYSKNGNLQAVKSPEQILFETLVSTLYGNDSYYESSNDKVKRMIKALNQVVSTHGLKGARYALNVARFAREEMFIRTMPIVMTVELAKILRDKNLQLDGFKAAVSYLIQRADELTDMYAYALTIFGSKTKIPLAIKKGVADAFNKFDAYQLGKYNRQDGLKFRDLLRIVHPKPADLVHAEIFNKIIAETLEAPYTWEVELSKNGQLPKEKQKSKAQLWTELIERQGSGSLGYMALIRNLRNMKEAGISDDTWVTVANRIKDPISVSKSKQLPFGFINAYDIAKVNAVPTVVLNALTQATELSLSNMPELGKRIWIILDCSGSMNGAINYSGYRGGNDAVSNTPIKIGSIFGAALVKASKNAFQVNFMMFDDYAKIIDLNPQDSIFTLYAKIMARNAGGGTNLQSAFDKKPELGFEPDTVIILSDMEVNRLQSKDTSKLFSPNCVKVAVNLNSGNTTPISEWQGWTQLSGWSERIFQFVRFTREGDSIVEKIFNAS